MAVKLEASMLRVIEVALFAVTVPDIGLALSHATSSLAAHSNSPMPTLLIVKVSVADVPSTSICSKWLGASMMLANSENSKEPMSQPIPSGRR